ncbi:hypothetical protein BGZ57DRAFT_880525 [Hyaloscypha finlandica]|nr:hypothetical protein BGZ57DRAFT_880525 [Hyaloscypha finlandica]
MSGCNAVLLVVVLRLVCGGARLVQSSKRRIFWWFIGSFCHKFKPPAKRRFLYVWECVSVWKKSSCPTNTRRLVSVLVFGYPHPNPGLSPMSGPSLCILQNRQGAVAVGWNEWVMAPWWTSRILSKELRRRGGIGLVRASWASLLIENQGRGLVRMGMIGFQGFSVRPVLTSGHVVLAAEWRRGGLPRNIWGRSTAAVMFGSI